MPKQPSQQDLVGVVSRYYAVVLKRLDKSWNLLGPAHMLCMVVNENGDPLMNFDNGR